MNNAYYFLIHIMTQHFYKYISFKEMDDMHSGSIESFKKEDWLNLLHSYEKFHIYKNSLDPILTVLQQELAILSKNLIHIVTFSDPRYPELLRHIEDPPAALLIKGDFTTFPQNSYSVVGSRKPSYQVAGQCLNLGRFFAKKNISVVSGGAFGCDIYTHRGFIEQESKGKAIAVFPGGLGQLVPHSNEPYFRKIVARGGYLVSERLYNRVPQKWDYPVRNRIISGLSEKTILMHAKSQSGAMITAKLALDQGRDVLVYYDKNEILSTGCEDLKNEGSFCFSNEMELESL